MSNEDDIPVLRNAVARKPQQGITPEQIDELCDSLSAETWVLIDKLLAEALRDAEQKMRVQISDRLNVELPALIEKALREKLPTDDD